MATASTMTIGQVSELLGVPVPTLRSWQLRYGVGAPARTPGGHRRYTDADVQALRWLNAAVARGIAPSTAAQALRELRSDPQPPVSLLLRMLELAGAGDQPGLLAALDQAEEELGTQDAVDRILIPAVREIGLRWELGAVDVGIEHLATTAVRRWIAQRMGTTGRRPGADPVLLAAAAGNEHTVALEAFGMLLDRRGWPVRLLGANTPVPAMVVAARTARVAAAVVTAHQVSRSRSAIEALRCLHREFGIPLHYAGAAFDNPRRRRGVPGTYLGTALPEAVRLVEASLSPQAAPGTDRQKSST